MITENVSFTNVCFLKTIYYYLHHLVFYIPFIIIMVIVWNPTSHLPPPPINGGGGGGGAMHISNYWIKEGWEKISINGQVTHSVCEGGRSKNGWVIHSKIILVQQKIFSKTFNFWSVSKNTPQVYSRTGTRYILFCISMFVVSVIIGVNK